MKSKTIVVILVNIVLSLVGVELVLRLQQHLGPLMDLEFEHISLEAIDNELNHRPTPGRSKRILEGASKYGKYDGYEFFREFGEHGIRKNKSRPLIERPETRILFMGDSFMMGFDDENTIPHHVWRYFSDHHAESQIEFINAGVSSYSPAIFIAQVKKLAPLVQPDLIVIDIDETDLFDDSQRYKNLIVRDTTGGIVRVKNTPINVKFIQDHVRIRSHTFYIARLTHKIYHKLSFPFISRGYRSWYGMDIFDVSREDGRIAREKYATEIKIFRDNLNEMAETVSHITGRADKVLFLFHPHLQHLKPDTTGSNWNDVVASSIGDVATQHGIHFYNATEDLGSIFGNHPEDYYWYGDMHFTLEGLREYGTLVARALLPIVKARRKQKTLNPPS